MTGEIVVEDGKSAFRGANQGAGSKLADLERRFDAGEFGPNLVIVTERLDRLSRQNAKVTFRWIDAMTQKGVAFFTCNDRRLYTADNLDMVGMIVLLIEADVAHKSSKEKSERIAASYAAKRDAMASGTFTPDPRIAPTWISIEGQTRVSRSGRKVNLIGGQYVLNAFAPLVASLCQRALDGEGVNAMAADLNREGIPSLGGSIWTGGNLLRLLKSRALIGDYRPKTKGEDGRPVEIDGQDWIRVFPAAVTEETFYAVQAALAGRRMVRGRVAATKHNKPIPNLIAGLTRCETCGAGMEWRGNDVKKGGDYLQCRNYRRGLCTAKRHFRYQPFETALLDTLSPLALDPVSFADPNAIHSLDTEILALEGKIDAKRASAANIAAMLDDRPSPTIVAHVGKLDKEIAELVADREKLAKLATEKRGRTSSVEHLRQVAEVRNLALAEGADPAEQQVARRRIQQALADLIETITFWPNRGRIIVSLVGNARAFWFDMGGRMGNDISFIGADEEPGRRGENAHQRTALEGYKRRLKAS